MTTPEQLAETVRADRDMRVPAIVRCWERAAKAMPTSDPTKPDDPSVNLDTLAAIATAKWWEAHDLEREVERLRKIVEKAPCECYDEPTLAPTDNPQGVVCGRCAALGSESE